MKNFNNFTNLMNGVLKKGPSGEVKRTRLEKGSNEHPMSIHSASIEHPLGSGGNQVETTIKPCIWKYAAMITLLLTLACGQMWGTEKYYLFTPTSAPNPSHAGTLSGAFHVQASATSSSETWTSGSYTFSHYIKNASNLSTWNTGNYYGTGSIDYDLKTTSVTFTLYVKTNANSKKVNWYSCAEDSAYAKTGSVSLSTNGQNTVSFTVATAAGVNKRVRISQDAYNNVMFYQIVAEETGTALPQPGQAGYALKISGDSNPKRFADAASSTKSGKIDGMEIVNAADLKYTSNTALKLSKNSTSTYIKFTTPSSGVGKLKVSASGAYSLNTTAAINATTTAADAETALSASTTYWIMASSGSEITISKIEFKAAAAADYCISVYNADVDDKIWDGFTEVATNHFTLSNFVVPGSSKDGWTKYWVGEDGAWSGTFSANAGMADMTLYPATSATLGQAAGAVGTLHLWDDSKTSGCNLWAKFEPDGYGMTYGGNSYAFKTTPTDHMLETDVVTLPNVSTTYNIGMETSTSGTYVKGGLSKSTDEALSAMGTTSIEGGLRKIWLYSTAYDWIKDGAKMAIWDATHSHWGDNTDAHKFMTKVNDNLWYGYVPTDAGTIILVRVNPANSDPGWGWGQSHDILPGDVNTYVTINGGWSDGKAEYTISSAHPAMGDKGKFRMWDNTNLDNWFVHWIPYFVWTYDANGGTGTMSPTERNSESSTLTATVASNGFTRTGYNFLGWNPNETQADAGTKDNDYDPNDTPELTSNQTLYAVWSEILHDVMVAYKCGETTIKSSTTVEDAGIATSQSVTAPDITGYTFSTWSSMPSGVTTASSLTSKTISINATADSKTITANYTANEYNITYLDEGGDEFSGYSIGTAPTTHTYATATALKKAVKQGYVFGGWYTDSKCTSSAGESLGATAYTADITLYAKWTAISMVDLVSGTFYGASDMVPAGVTVSGSSQAYPGVSADQRFNMLGTTSTAMSSKTMSSTSLINASAVTEYLDFEGSASLSTYTPSTKAVQFKIPAAGQLEVWANSGIYLSNGSSETSISPSSNYAIVTVAAGTYYLYAQNTSRKLYGIRYKKTHSVSAVTSTGTTTYGTVSASPTTVAEDSASIITAVPATGYQVTNWAKTSGTGASISPSGSSNSNTTTLTMGTTDATVTVTFGAINYTITHSDPTGDGTYTISVAGGSAVSTNTTANYGQTITLAATPGEGYEFTSWTVTGATSGDAITVTSDQFSMPAENVTVTATFTATATYTVTYKANGGTGDDVEDDAATTIADNTFTAPATKAFAGWNTKSDGKGTDYAVGDAVSGDLTLYAQWKYKVYYIASSASESNDVTTALASKYVVSVHETTSTSYNASDYSDYALIVLSESLSGGDATTSGHELKVIVGLNKPILNLKSYFYNSGRWGWGTPNAGKNSKGIYVKNDTYANLTSHPIYSGLTPNGSDSIVILSSTHKDKKPIQPIGSFESGKEGYTLAKVANNDSGSGTAIHELTAAQRSTITGQSISEKYLLISIYSGDLSHLTTDGKTLIKNAADYLITGSQWVPQYAITHSEASNGSYTIKVGDASAVSTNTTSAAGTTITLAATPSSGYELGSWTVTGDVSSGSVTVTSNTFTMPAEAVTVAATFVEGCTKPGTPTRPTIEDGTLTHAGATFVWDPAGATANSNGYVVSIVKVSDGSTVLDWTSSGIYKEGGAGGLYDATELTGSTEYYFIVKAIGDAGYCSYGDTSRLTFTTLGTPYTITYHLNGASWINEGAATYRYGTGYTLPVAGDISNTGYTFDGWKDNSSLTGDSKTTIGTSEYGDKEFWAKWTENTYTITYNANGGTLDGSQKTSYNIETEDYDLPTPTKDNYVFQGWYTDEDFTSDRVYTLKEGSTGDKTYYAKWGSAVTATWSETANAASSSKFYAGSNGHTVTVYLDQADWDTNGDKDDLVLTASDGVTLSSITKSINGDGKAQVSATFAIDGSVDGDITFALSVPATSSYSAVELEETLSLDDCPGGSTTVTLTNFGANKGNSSNKPSSLSKYFWSYAGTTMTSAYAYTITTGNTGTQCGNGGKDSTYMTLKYGSSSNNGFMDIYADNTRTEGTPSTFSNVTAISLKIKAKKSNPTLTITIGGTSVASAVTLEDLNTSTYTTYTYNNLSNLSGAIRIQNNGSTADYDLYLDDIAITYSGTGGVETSLAWSESLADKATVNKDDVDPDFRYYASPTPSNAGGPINYTSSNTSVATVSSNGTVHIVNSGTTTITASMPAYGCYNAATSITYSLVVANICEDEPGTISAGDPTCSGIKLTVDGHTKTASTHYQWYRVGSPDETVGTDQDNYTATTAGTYYVKVNNTASGGCTLVSTNKVTMKDASTVDPTIFADEFTVKQDHWFGYRLMEINNGESVSVKTAPTGWVEDLDFKITTKNNIVSIEGNVKRSTGDKTLTLTVANECGATTDEGFTIHEIAAPAKPTVAWIATGDTKGEKTCKASESTNTGLYKYLEDYYTMTAINCYWSTSEADLVKEYSKYDLVILTDYPNSGTCPTGKSGKSNSYTNAIGQLIDHRPIMTFEAFVAGCPNWGIPTNPSNTKSTQASMTLLCNAGEIFGDESGIFAAGKDIAVTEASSGQALQGFPVASLPDYVFIGKITDSDDKEYVACCERQVETGARTLIFGLNSALMSNLTDNGKLMVQKFADYLLETDPASIPDCSVIFNGGGADDSWYTTDNWEGGSLPDEYASVRLDVPCEVPSNASPAKAGSIKIHQGGAFTGSLTIKPAGCMIVEKGITRVEGDEYTVHKRTQPSDVVIEANATNQGALIFNNESTRTQATVQMYSKAHYDEQDLWQYVAVPLVSASRWNMGDWAFKYDNASQGWSYYEETYYAFDGIGLTQDDAATYEFEGELASTTKKTIPLYPGNNMVGNSWTAPIHIVNFDEDKDFGSATATVFIYETGHDPDGGATNTDGNTSTPTAGKWHSIPIASARTAIAAGTWNGMTVIPAMQAFEVKTTSNTSLTLNYDQLVRDLPTSADTNEPLHAPRKGKSVNTTIPQMRITMSDGKARNDVYLFSGERFSEGFDNGWDGEFMKGESRYAQLYAITPNGNLAISAQPEMEGTVLGFAAGVSEEYTMTFRYIGDETLYLNDMSTQTSTLIDDESEYTFTALTGEQSSRFVISSIPFEAPQIPTGITNLDAEAPKVRKVLINDMIYIIRGGKIYSIDGAMVK